MSRSLLAEEQPLNFVNGFSLLRIEREKRCYCRWAPCVSFGQDVLKVTCVYYTEMDGRGEQSHVCLKRWLVTYVLRHKILVIVNKSRRLKSVNSETGVIL